MTDLFKEIVIFSVSDYFYVDFSPITKGERFYKCKISLTEGFEETVQSNVNISHQPKNFAYINVTKGIEVDNDIVKQTECLSSLKQFLITMAILTFIVTSFMIIAFITKTKKEEDDPHCETDEHR